MEKYAVDLKSIPPTDDQLRCIKKLLQEQEKTAGEANNVFTMPRTAEEAEEVIRQLEEY